MIWLESIEENKNFLILKEQYDEVLREKEMLINQIENQEQDKQTIGKHLINTNLFAILLVLLSSESTNSARLEKETEMVCLSFNISSHLLLLFLLSLNFVKILIFSLLNSLKQSVHGNNSNIHKLIFSKLFYHLQLKHHSKK